MTDLRERITALLHDGFSNSDICEKTGASPAYVGRIRSDVGRFFRVDGNARFIEGWNWFVSGRKRATAHEDFWRGWNAAQGQNATAPMTYGQDVGAE